MSAMQSSAAAAPVSVRTVVVDDPAPLLAQLPGREPVVAWIRGGEGLVGWGEAARLDTSGPGRFAAAARWWRATCAGLAVTDEVGEPGTGPVAFVSLAFADHPGRSSLVVPRVLLGRRDGRTWMTTVGAPAPLRSPTLPRAPSGLRYSDGALTVGQWRDAVADAVRRIQAGSLDKVVLARDLVASVDAPVDPRWLAARLAADYPSCWTFSVDGLVGATPELLVRRQGTAVTSQVLAGTAWRHGALDDDAAVAAALLASVKDQKEHRFAAASVATALGAHCTSLQVGEPEVLRLANVAHLATDVTGRVADGSDVLALAAALHPTAAVAGTPTAAALELLAELEQMDRGRYAGPVGWVDSRGDGELGIALRCAQLEGAAVRLFAGCGIVADSDPDTEVAEAQAKLVPVRDALGAPRG